MSEEEKKPDVICPFCGSSAVESDIPNDMKTGHENERWLTCSGGCWIDGVSIPESRWTKMSETASCEVSCFGHKATIVLGESELQRENNRLREALEDIAEMDKTESLGLLAAIELAETALDKKVESC